MQQEAVPLAFDWVHASFEEAESEVRQWGDTLGNGLDSLIVPVVAGLNLFGIRTIQSCEGHLDHGFAYPWIMFERPLCSCYAVAWQHCEDDSEQGELEAYHASDQLREAMEECPHRPEESLRLTALLASFSAAATYSSATLTVEYTDATFYRLIPVVSSTPREDQKETLARCQAEMARFANFLKELCHQREKYF
jgi:hypothetical protein